MDNRNLLFILLVFMVLFQANSKALNKINVIKSPFRNECGKQFLATRSRIFGGHRAEIGEYPWLVQMLHAAKNNSSTRGCTGFIIHEKFILTAAHCVSPFIQDRFGPIHQVVLGEHDTVNERDCKLFNRELICADPPVYANIAPKRTIIHKGYNDSPSNRDHHYDIAILQLKKPITYTKYIQPICLAEETTQEKQFFISGWGKTEVERSSNIKLKAQIPKADQEECIAKYDDKDITIDESQICAGGISGVDSCSGDSGGPLMVQMNFTWYAEGIVSFGRECGLQGWPGIYTNIPYYIDWIKTKIVNRLENDKKIAQLKKNKN